MSGDYNTSLGNTIVNQMAFHSLLSGLGVPYDAIYNGDDSVVCIQEANLDVVMAASQSHFAKLGLETKMGVVRDIYDVDFCQGHVVETAIGWRLVRHPTRALSHTAVSIKKYGGKRWLAWLRAVGECEAATNKGVPILQAYAQCLMRNAWAGGRVNALYERDLWYRKGCERVGTAPITHQARFGFWQAFGIPPSAQIAIEERFAKFDFVNSRTTAVLDSFKVARLPEVTSFWMHLVKRYGIGTC